MFAAVRLVESTNLLVGVLDEGTSYDFCMCNPPFFKDSVERDGVNKKQQVELSGADHEVITEGGEVQFVKKIISDSLKLRSKIRYCIEHCTHMHAYTCTHTAHRHTHTCTHAYTHTRMYTLIHTLWFLLHVSCTVQ